MSPDIIWILQAEQLQVQILQWSLFCGSEAMAVAQPLVRVAAGFAPANTEPVLIQFTAWSLLSFNMHVECASTRLYA